MKGFVAVSVQAMLARAVSATVEPDGRAAAQRLVVDLLGSCPETFKDVPFESLAGFVTDTGTDAGHAAAVVAASRARADLSGPLLEAFLARPGLSLSYVESFVCPVFAASVAAASDRPDILELVFTDSVASADTTVLEGLVLNDATPPPVREQAVLKLLDSVGPDPDLSDAGTALRALREHPETQRPVFDALDLPPVTLLKLFALTLRTSGWSELSAAQLDRLVAVFEQVLSSGDGSFDWVECSRALLWHPNISAVALRRLLDAADGACALTSPAEVHDWFRELVTTVEVLAAPNPVVELRQGKPRFLRYPGLRRRVLASATAAELVEALTVPATPPHRTALVARDIVKYVPFRVCTPELAAALPVVIFREWYGTSSSPEIDEAVAALLVDRLGTAVDVYRVFADLAETAGVDVTVGEIADLAASLAAGQ